MLYLYFGKTKDDLKNFALRDLGVIRTNKNANLSARFTDEAGARACFHYSRLLMNSKKFRRRLPERHHCCARRPAMHNGLRERPAQ